MPEMAAAIEPEVEEGAPYGVRLSIIVVSYNTREMTLDALRSAIEQTRDTSYEIIVVDNASSDGSAEAIAALGGPVRLIALSENIGFARANNVAASEAHGEFILLLNPDTVVIDRGIDRLLAFADERPGAGIWGGRSLFADGRLNPTCCWRRPTPWNAFCRVAGLTGLFPASALFNTEAYGGWRRDAVAEVDIVSGSFLLIRHDIWRALEGFDPAFFMYGEEADLCLRARALGARPLFTPDARIIHYGGASETTRKAKIMKLLAAKAELIRRHWHPALRSLGIALLALWPLSRFLALSIAAIAGGRLDLKLKAQTWREIWAGRHNWVDAYRPERARAEPFAPLAARLEASP
jgi:hypothetical protein